MQGFGAGVIWGGALGLFGLALASLMAPLPGAPGDTPPSPGAAAVAVPAAVTVPAASEFARPKPDADPVLPQGTPAPVPATVPRLPAPTAASAAPSPGTNPSVPSVDTAGKSAGPADAATAAEPAPALPAPLADPGPKAPAVSGPAAPARETLPVRP